MCGLGYGCVYTPPIQALLEWFPDKRGMASGIVIAGFGSGALFFSPVMGKLMDLYSVMPEYLGSSVDTTTSDEGKLFAVIQQQESGSDNMREVVYATATDLSKLPYSDLSEGFYVVGSGNTGIAAALATIAAIYSATVLASAFLIRKPPPGYRPPGWEPSGEERAAAAAGSVSASDVLRVPQFWLLFATAATLCTGGMGLMSVAKPMISDVFASSMPLVTSSFASSYLMAMACGNLGGRLGWAAVSDRIGRRATFVIFTLGAIPIFGLLPHCVNQVKKLITEFFTALFSMHLHTSKNFHNVGGEGCLIIFHYHRLWPTPRAPSPRSTLAPSAPPPSPPSPSWAAPSPSSPPTRRTSLGQSTCRPSTGGSSWPQPSQPCWGRRCCSG